MKSPTPALPKGEGEKKKIYIAGKVTDLPEKEVADKFDKAQKELEALGFEVINPVLLVHNYLVKEYYCKTYTPSEVWKTAMQLCIKVIVDCDGVLLLPDWMRSKGAKLEVEICDQLGIQTFDTITDLQQKWNN